MKDKALSLVFRGGAIGMKFILIIYLSKFKGTEFLGAFALFSVSVLLAVYFMGLDYYTYSLRKTISLTKTEDKLDEISSQFIFYFLSFLVFSVFIYPLFFQFDWIDESVIYVFLPLLLFELLSQEFFRLFNALKEIRIANLVYFIRNGSWIFLYLLFDGYVQSDSSILRIVTFWLCSSSLSVVFSIYFLVQKLNWKFPGKLPNNLISNYRNGFSVAKVFFFSTVLLKVIEYINRYIIEFYWGLEGVGVYSFYASISNVQVVACDVLIFSIVYPKLIENYNLKKRDTILNIQKSSMKNVIIINLIFIIIIPISIKAFVNTYYDVSSIKENVNIIFVLCLSSFFLNVSYIYHFILYAAQKDISILKSNAFVTVFGIVLNFIFIKHFGVWGAVWAACIVSVSLVILKRYYIRKVFHAIF
jgi:O-antigen/teichoic acid export membrane protein